MHILYQKPTQYIIQHHDFINLIPRTIIKYDSIGVVISQIWPDMTVEQIMSINKIAIYNVRKRVRHLFTLVIILQQNRRMNVNVICAIKSKRQSVWICWNLLELSIVSDASKQRA